MGHGKHENIAVPGGAVRLRDSEDSAMKETQGMRGIALLGESSNFVQYSTWYCLQPHAINSYLAREYIRGSTGMQ